MTPASVGSPFGPFSVFERLGVGGMASVHRARERLPSGESRPVALKRLLAHLVDDEEFVRSFVREAQLASMLEHPNIIKIHELGRVKGEYFISMEYIHGQDLRLLLRRARRVAGPPPIPVIVSLLRQLCSALDYAHTKRDDRGQPLGLVHRDISPSNLLVTNGGRLKIIDFGIAKATLGQLATRTGRIKGKLSYMAPELFAGGAKVADARSDLFSVGVIAHELCCAHPLFGARDDFQTIKRVQTLAVQKPSKSNQSVPPELDALILKALERAPSSRWQAASELLDALAELTRKHQIFAAENEVAQWCQWAFGLPEPSRDHGRAASSADSIESAVLDVADQEDARRAWGTERRAPVLLDDVPDVSERHLKGSEHPSTLLDAQICGGGSVTEVLPSAPDHAMGTAGLITDDDDDDLSTAVREPTGERMEIDLSGDDLLEEEPTEATAAEGKRTPRTARGTQLPRPATDSPGRLTATTRPTERAPSAPELPPTPRISFRQPTGQVEARADAGGGSAADSGTSGSPAIVAAGPPPVVPAEARLPEAGEPQPQRWQIPVRAETETTTMELPPRPHDSPLGGPWAHGTIPPPTGPDQPGAALPLPPPTPSADLAPSPRRYPWWLLAAGWVGALVLGVMIAALLTRDDSGVSRRLVSAPDTKLRIQSAPADAVVYVDEMETSGAIDVAAGSYQIRVEKDGYLPWRESVSVERGEKLTMRVVLEPVPAIEKEPAAPVEDVPDDDAPVIIDSHDAEVVDRSSLYVEPMQGEEVPHRLRTLICIDAEGAVTSARIETKIPDEWRPELVQRIKTWRYQPHQVDGEARRACFEAYPRVRER